MDPKSKLLLSMVISTLLVVLSEGLILLVIASILKVPVLFMIPALLVFWLIQYLISPYLVGRNSLEVSPGGQYGWLYNLVAEIALRSGVKPPRVFLVDSPYPNAFAFGNSLTGRRVGITVPLLEILNREELVAVIAHEIGHIKHKDVEIGMTLGLIPTALGYISTLLLNLGFFTILLAADEVEFLAALLLMALGTVLFIVTFTLQIFVLWFNRLRESYADYHSFSLLGEGSEALLTALAKIEIYMQKVRLDPFTGIIVTAAPVKVEEEDPYLLVKEWLRKKVSVFTDILSTHPHPARRAQMIETLLEGGDRG
ncbi:M48 family metalloprotease [Metallosphaera tengchongensis]|uniref:Protease HtpX homolog n=1 Tax=Metallosphaera tengchongensis TaxID=1532350 RepID=A0A6N0P0B0_9CREN|nr:zinc metalloprotease HtpX [Metallosphaera tengchongensis]QKR00791.1 M48 family metalloprotease [Metallosphaera tengchongensis]